MDLSIIIPTYNSNSTLPSCLQALEHNGAEIIVIDDGSPNRVEVPPNVRLVRHLRNRGRAAALNTGVRAASNDLVLIMDDYIRATPEMVVNLAEEFAHLNNPAVAVVGRVLWDPELKLTLTMRWLQEAGPFHDISSDQSGLLSKLATVNTMMWRPFIQRHGGFNEKFTQYGVEDAELGLRLKQHGLEIHLLASAVGYRHKVMKVRDLVSRQLQDGLAAVYLHSQFPEYMPQVEDTESLQRNAAMKMEAAAAVEEIALLEQADSGHLLQSVSEFFALIHHHYFLKGIVHGRSSTATTVQAATPDTGIRGLFNAASHLEATGELSEARRMFRLIRERQDPSYWADAEYHLGRIEASMVNEEIARAHFKECLRLNPSHRKAHEALKLPVVFREVRPNCFERINPLPQCKVLLVVFGALDNVMNAFPVVAALRDRFASSEIVWLTLPQFASLAHASDADSVRTSEPRGVIPWQWVHSEGFTHVFYPEINANEQEWETSHLHPIDFMAWKCDVKVESHQSWLEPGPEAVLEVESFLAQNGILPKSFLSIYYRAGDTRHWPSSHLAELRATLGMTIIVIGGPHDEKIEGTIPFFGRSFHVMAALIRSSAYYLGPDCELSWIAATTNTPMGVFTDPAASSQNKIGFKQTLGLDKENLTEWNVHTELTTVVDCIANHTVQTGVASLI